MSAERELAPAPAPAPIEPQAAPAPPRHIPTRALTPATVLALQRTAGNAAVTSLMRSHTHAETQPPAKARDVRVVEFMPTLPEPGVTYVIGKPEQRYTFDVTYAGGGMHYKNLSSGESIAKLRQVHWMLLDDLEHARADHEKRWREQNEHLKTTFLVDLRTGSHMPSPGIWDKVRRGTLSEALALINSSDEAVRARWEQDRGAMEAYRNDPPTQRASWRAWAEHGYDPTEERIKRTGVLIEKAGRELDTCGRELDQYLERSVESAGRWIRDIKITIMVLSAAAGGAGAGFAGEGAGLLSQAAYSAGTMGFLGAAEETAGQLGEIHYGLRDHFDVKALGKRVARDVVLGFVGGVIGGKFSQVLKSSLGGWIKTVSDAELVAAGVTREELLTSYERLFVEFAGGSLGSSPFTTVTGTVLDQALDGELHVHTWGDFAKSVLDQLIADGKMGAFLTAIGRAGAKHGRVEPAAEHAPAPSHARAAEHAPAAERAPAVASPEHPTPPKRPNPEYVQRPPGRRPSTGHPKPPKTPKPVIEESPPGGFEPTTKEPAPEDYGPAPHQDELVLPGETPKREPLNPGNPERTFHMTAAELEQALHDALHELYERGKAALGGGPNKLDAWVAEVAKSDPELAGRIKRYHLLAGDPGWVKEQMVHLWEQARDNSDTTAGELVRELGGKERGITEFWNTETEVPKWYEEFRRAIADPKIFVDMPLAGDTHGAHVHAFHEFLADRLFGPGEGLKFRQAIAALKNKGTMERSGQGDTYEKPAWSHIWDSLHDADIDGGLHWPEGLGKILQEHLDFPRWDPGERPQ